LTHSRPVTADSLENSTLQQYSFKQTRKSAARDTQTDRITDRTGRLHTYMPFLTTDRQTHKIHQYTINIIIRWCTPLWYSCFLNTMPAGKLCNMPRWGKADVLSLEVTLNCLQGWLLGHRQSSSKQLTKAWSARVWSCDGSARQMWPNSWRFQSMMAPVTRHCFVHLQTVRYEI